jgi:hypothetical protein
MSSSLQKKDNGEQSKNKDNDLRGVGLEKKIRNSINYLFDFF